MANLRRENGSISVMVLVTILFIIVILSATFMINSTQRKSQLLSQVQLKETYESDMDKADEIYDSLPGGSWEELEDGSITNGKIKVQVGDYVNYPNPTTVQVTGTGYSQTGYTSYGSQTGMSTADGYTATIDQTYTLNSSTKWRVLGLSEDGNKLLLTTEEPLQRDYDSSATVSESNSPYFYLRGAKGCAYEYGLKELNKICAMYKNKYADEVRSLTIDDINRLCKVTVDVANGKVTKEGDTTTNINKWGNIGTTYTYPTSGYPTQYKSPEDYLAGKKVTTLNSFSKTSDAYYYVGSDAIDSTSALYDILFAGTGQTDGDYRYYWLASRAVYVSSDFCYWGPGDVHYGEAGSGSSNRVFDSYGGLNSDHHAVRPVATLKSNVELTSAGTNTWNIVEQ